MLLHLVAFLALSLVYPVVAVENETFCLSRYDYDYKMLQKIVMMEQDQRNMKQMLDQQDITIRQQQQVIEQLQTDQTVTARSFEERIRDISLITGSTYIRWGRTTCQDNGTETVYTGYAGGSYWDNYGSGANTLCLPQDPIWGEYIDGMGDHGAYIYGTEYRVESARSNKLFKKNLYKQEAPCAVCRSTRPSVVMIPARNACYEGWTTEYTGYIMSGRADHKAASEHLCLDDNPETIEGNSELKAKAIYLTEAGCGTLKCPPYVNGRELTCVVCTK